MQGRGGPIGVAALIALFVMAPAAHAKIDASDVSGAKVREKSFTPDGVEPVGGSVNCPKGDRVLSGGAFWHEPSKNSPVKPEATGFPTLSASMPTVFGRGWYAQGTSSQGETLTIRILCTRAGHLNDYLLLAGTLYPDDGDPVAGTETCDPGHVAFTGGSGWALGYGEETPDHAERGLLASNAIGEDRRTWYSDGLDVMDAQPNGVGIVRAIRCLPNKQLAKTVIRERSAPAAAGGEAAAKVACPGRQRALAGGAVWHTGDGDPNIFTNAGIQGGSSAATKDRRGWYAHGDNEDTGGFRTLTVRVLCLK
ncbi:MAG TPA: hypothetical protein VD766_08970 [Solirubrobacterales bacterium]|nr:hypothetical protein [Solirubrobacterales bacterium]